MCAKINGMQKSKELGHQKCYCLEDNTNYLFQLLKPKMDLRLMFDQSNKSQFNWFIILDLCQLIDHESKQRK